LLLDLEKTQGEVAANACEICFPDDLHARAKQLIENRPNRMHAAE
jgi:hypothetical protein